MTDAETMDGGRPQTTTGRSGIGRVLRAFTKPVKFVVSALLLLTPVTAVIILGWLQRLTERKAVKYLDRHLGAVEKASYPWPGLIIDDGFRLSVETAGQTPALTNKSERNFFGRWFGGLWDNLKAGLQALLALAILTLPFGALWFLGWWSGWQNSFTKGYEQAFAGPVISLLGVALSLACLSYLPMALAHLALERKVAAFFELRKVIKLIHISAWRYIALTIAFVVAAFPVFLATSAPVFIENIKPGFLDMSPQELQEFKDAYHVWMSVYILIALIVLRSWTGRIYTRSAVQANSFNEKAWRDTRLIGFARARGLNLSAAGSPENKRSEPGKIRAIILTLALPTIWFGLVAQTYVGQFLNYRWWNWLNHPLIGIPWFPPLGPWG